MTWARLDDGLHDHPKFIGLPLASVGLWTLCLSYAGKRRDAVIPASLPRRFGATSAHCAALVTAGLWDVIEQGWRIHDWEHYTIDGEQQRKAANARWRNAGAHADALRSVSPRDGIPPEPEPIPEPESARAREDRLFAPVTADHFLDDPAVEAFRRTCEGFHFTVTPSALAGCGGAARELRRLGATDADLVEAAVRCATRGGSPSRLDLDLGHVQRQRDRSAVDGQRRTEEALRALEKAS